MEKQHIFNILKGKLNSLIIIILGVVVLKYLKPEMHHELWLALVVVFLLWGFKFLFLMTVFDFNNKDFSDEFEQQYKSLNKHDRSKLTQRVIEDFNQQHPTIYKYNMAVYVIYGLIKYIGVPVFFIWLILQQ